MTASRHPESRSPSRRALLAGALGGIGVWVAGAIGRASPVRGAGDDASPILVGSSFTDVRTQTTLSDHANDNTVLSAASSSGSGFGGGIAIMGYSDHGAGVWGETNGGPSVGVRGSSGQGTGVLGSSDSSVGVWGASNSNYGTLGVSGVSSGIYGMSTSGDGVHGNSSTGHGVYGFTSSAQSGTVGHSAANGTGVLGFSGPISLPAAKAKTGVYGYAAQDGGSRGVWGISPAGHAVHGTSTNGYAGYFAGKVYTTRFYEMKEITDPLAPTNHKARLFLKDNGSGKTQLCVRFNTGAIQVLATQP